VADAIWRVASERLIAAPAEQEYGA
jgi:hypothetical protein